ncbi:MAG TPA: peptidylprolyl isomerase [Vicinamibacterales bacterium]|jgi:cyclophilin family peptidyl-prolyl cis-trans isomerase|nr:peptidylprolyl isomerase [Vicinamibacterales bacterium]
MKRAAWAIAVCGASVLGGVLLLGQATGIGPVIVVETTKGTFAIETFSREAPKTVAHVVALVKRGFYDGQRVHRAVPDFLIQWGDPRSRDAAREGEWGRGPDASSGTPIGTAEVSRKRLHVPGAVGVSHPGKPAAADSQLYVTLAKRPDLDGYYTIFGQVIAGVEIPSRLERGDLITKMYVRE